MLKKCNLKNGARVTFILPAEEEVESVYLVGDFNAWNPEANPLIRNRTGMWQATLDLEPNREYQFRYLVNQSIWRNDDAADGHASNPYGSDNSVVRTAIAAPPKRARSSSKTAAILA